MTLDTRSKIVNLEEARTLACRLKSGGASTTAFVTHLEVLRAGHIRKLEGMLAANAHQATGKLFLILTDPESPLDSLDARAEVAAGLRAVDYVIPSPGGPTPALAAIEPDVIVDDEEEDRLRTRELIEHVRSRARV